MGFPEFEIFPQTKQYPIPQSSKIKISNFCPPLLLSKKFAFLIPPLSLSLSNVRD